MCGQEGTLFQVIRHVGWCGSSKRFPFSELSAVRLQISSYEAVIEDLETTPFGVLIVPGHADALITLYARHALLFLSVVN